MNRVEADVKNIKLIYWTALDMKKNQKQNWIYRAVLNIQNRTIYTGQYYIYIIGLDI
jgi:hypothetical protein